MAARVFLYLIAGLIALIVVGAIAWNVFEDRLLAIAFVPDAPVEQLAEVEQSRYADADMWLARPGMRRNPTSWLPEGVEKVEGDKLPVFYVLPTTYLDNDRWNAPFRDPVALERQRLFAASQASAFTNVGEIWAPLYRQAAVGTFLSRGGDADQALRFAYRDVAAAFDYFLTQIPHDQRFIIAGHSQGALHLATLLRERIAGTPIAERIAAAYLIGWPISIEADLPALGLPACEAARQGNCIVSFQSFAEPAEPRQILNIYNSTRGYTGEPRRGTPMLCVNPLTGRTDTDAAAEANDGTLVPIDGLTNADLQPGLIPAQCGERGFLLIGPPPEGFDRYVLPGNNYHVFDFMLFWANLREDVARRTSGLVSREG